MVTKVPPALGPDSGLTLIPRSSRSAIEEMESHVGQSTTKFTNINRKIRSKATSENVEIIFMCNDC